MSRFGRWFRLEGAGGAEAPRPDPPARVDPLESLAAAVRRLATLDALERECAAMRRVIGLLLLERGETVRLADRDFDAADWTRIEVLTWRDEHAGATCLRARVLPLPAEVPDGPR